MNNSVIQWIPLCRVDALGEGEARAFDVPGREPLALCRVEGRFYVTDDTCTHAKASLASEGWLDGHRLICPVHAGEFDVRDGAPLCFPAERALRTYPVKVERDTVYANISSERKDCE